MESKRKIRLGQVVSNKMDKTVVVAVETPKRHPLYKKTMRRVVKYKAHDEKNKCQVGDKVRIVETRPLSRDKRWRVDEIITKGEVVEILPVEIGEIIGGEVAEVKPEKKAKEKVAEVKAEKKAKEKVAEVKAEKKTKGEVAEVKAEKKKAKAKPEEKTEGES